MNPYQLLCLDIDGTLLNSHYEITAVTRSAIRWATDLLHVPVILVSARMPASLRLLQGQLGIAAPIISYGGALIEDAAGQTLAASQIDLAAVRQIWQLTQRFGVHLSVFAGDHWYVGRLDAMAARESQIVQLQPEIVNFADLFMCWEEKRQGPNKLLCLTEPHSTTAFRAAILQQFASSLNILPSSETYLEVMAPQTSKQAAVAWLGSWLGIPRSAIIAVGDNFNDIDMLEYAGLGIAMGNAPDAVKQRADAVTLSNDEDGVAAVIDRYFRFSCLTGQTD